MKLVLIGPYPPPYGGIATTVQDLHRYLSGQPGYEVEVLDIGEGRHRPALALGLFVLWFALRRYMIHLETNGHNLKSWLSALVCAAAGRLNRRRTVIAFGSGNLPAYLRDLRGWPRIVVRAVVAWAGALICRNQPMRAALRAAGADPEKIAVVPGFLGLAAARPEPVPPAVREFFLSHEPVLGAATGPGPEYGIPLLLAALADLVPTFPKIGLVLIGPCDELDVPAEGLAAMRERVCVTGPQPREVALGIVQQLALFVRPTWFDGDSNSVREALELGVPVVASRTATRPPGVLTFQVGEAQGLARAVRDTIERPDEARRRLEAYQRVNGFERVLTLYRGLAEAGER